MTTVVQNLVLASVIFLMLDVGLRTSFRELADVVRQIPLMMRGLLANFLVIPLLFFVGLAWLPVSTEVVIGLLIMAAAPVAPMAPQPFVGIAKGDLTYAAGLMAVVAVLCVPLTPLLLTLILPSGEQGVSVDAMKIVQIVLTGQLIPIFVGLVIHQFSATWTDRLRKFVPVIGQGGLLISIVLIIIVGAQQFIGLGVVALVVILAAVFVCLLVGDWMMAGESLQRRRSLGICTAVRNPALGLLIGTSNFAGTDAIPTLLVFATLSMIVALGYGKLLPAEPATARREEMRRDE
jgi:BASS family bile acid:Na+ symporter